MALVLKTSDAERHRGFESLSLRECHMEKYPSGPRGSPAKGVACDECGMGSNPIFSVKIKESLESKAFLLFMFEIAFDCAGRESGAQHEHPPDDSVAIKKFSIACAAKAKTS